MESTHNDVAAMFTKLTNGLNPQEDALALLSAHPAVACRSVMEPERIQETLEKCNGALETGLAGWKPLRRHP